MYVAVEKNAVQPAVCPPMMGIRVVGKSIAQPGNSVALDRLDVVLMNGNAVETRAVLQAQSVLRERVSVRQRPRQSHVQNLHPSRKLNQLQNCLRLHLQQFRQLNPASLQVPARLEQQSRTCPSLSSSISTPSSNPLEIL